MSWIMFNEIVERLGTIGEESSKGMAYVWQASMRQAFLVKGVLWLVADISFLTAGVIGVFFAIRFFKSVAASETRDDEATAQFVCGCGLGVAAVVLLLIGIIDMPSSIAHTLNPAYYALMDLAKLIGK